MVKEFEVMRGGLKLTGVLIHIDFETVGRLSDYRTSLSLKGERLFHTKNTRLLLYDYQRTARYYTIYRTFKQWSSDGFTTILRLFAGRNYDYSSRSATTISDLY